MFDDVDVFVGRFMNMIFTHTQQNNISHLFSLNWLELPTLSYALWDKLL